MRVSEGDKRVELSGEGYIKGGRGKKYESDEEDLKRISRIVYEGYTHPTSTEACKSVFLLL